MKKLQKGRSMIEMLGVLAIIGVLSIGGLAGYTMAMNRWRANTITDYVTRCVVVSQTKGVTGEPAHGNFGDATNCAKILNEDIPGFLTGAQKKVYISDYARNTDTTVATVVGLSSAVDDVLVAKFNGANISGVEYATGGTFTFRPVQAAAPAQEQPAQQGG